MNRFIKTGLPAFLLSLASLSLAAPVQAKTTDKQEFADEMAISFASIANKGKHTEAQVEGFAKVGRCIADQVAAAVPDQVFEQHDVHNPQDNQYFLDPLLSNRDNVEKNVVTKCSAPAKEYRQLTGSTEEPKEMLDYLLNTVYAQYEQADFEAKGGQ